MLETTERMQGLGWGFIQEDDLGFRNWDGLQEFRPIPIQNLKILAEISSGKGV